MNTDDDHEDARQRALSTDIREEMRGMGPILLAGLIPLGLVLMVLSSFVPKLPAIVLPAIFIAYCTGLPLYVAYRRRMESDLPFVIPGHGSFTGRRKQKLLAGGAVLVTLTVTVLMVLEVQFEFWIRAMRDWLIGWRIW
ncbi:MAG: hypothetical protein WBA68_09180 [Alteraurantiacibacter sp.]